MNKIPEKQTNAAIESESNSLNSSSKICVQLSEAESEPRKTSTMELFTKSKNSVLDVKPLTIFDGVLNTPLKSMKNSCFGKYSTVNDVLWYF